jgi:hypothetical protein
MQRANKKVFKLAKYYERNFEPIVILHLQLYSCKFIIVRVKTWMYRNFSINFTSCVIYEGEGPQFIDRTT